MPKGACGCAAWTGRRASDEHLRGIELAGETSNPLGTERIGKLLVRFAVPTSLTLMVSFIYNIIAQVFVGQGLGLDAVAATNVAFPATTVAGAVALMIGDGCAANVSLALGRGDRNAADRFLGCALALLAISGVAFCGLGLLFLEPLVRLLGASDSVLSASMLFTGFTLAGIPFLMCNMVLCAIIRADGNPQFTMKATLAGALVSTAVTPILLFVADWGLAGAGVGLVAGQFVSGALCLSYIPRFKFMGFKRENFAIRRTEAAAIVKLGAPSLFTQLAMAATQIVMNNLMRVYGAQSYFGSEVALSVYGTMIKVYQLAHAMFVGVGSATQPINGFNFGAKRYARVRSCLKLSLTASLVISVAWFAVWQLFPAQIANLFVSGDPLYTEFSVVCYRTYMAAFFVYGIPITAAAFFQALGKPLRSMTVSLSRQVVFLIPLALLLSAKFGLMGALIAAPVADALCFIVAAAALFAELRAWRAGGLLD